MKIILIVILTLQTSVQMYDVRRGMGVCSGTCSNKQQHEIEITKKIGGLNYVHTR